MQSKVIEAVDEVITASAAAALATALMPGLLITLTGDLGAGKTTFVRALLRSLGHQGAVKSPTYTIVEPYTIGPLTLYHFDLYRIADVEELEMMGLRDYLDGESISFIEWPQRASGFLPQSDIEIELRQGSNILSRQLILSAHSVLGEDVLSSCHWPT